MQEMDLDMQIKRQTLRKLDLEIKKLEREVNDHLNAYFKNDSNTMYSSFFVLSPSSQQTSETSTK